MARLFISEYQFMGANDYDEAQIAREPSLVDQVVDFSGGATASAAFSANTNYIRIWSDIDCCVKFGTSPVATTANRPITAKVAESCGVTPGAKVSAITFV
jgi:hypothetical protein